MTQIRLEYDDSPESPLEGSDWEVWSFSTRHHNFKHPSEFLPPDIGLCRKLDAGTAFPLSCYQHGNCEWSLQGEGPQCQWDTAQTAGILIWRGRPRDIGRTPEARRACARAEMATYTAWVNGEVYGYVVEDANGNSVSSCWGFYDGDEMIREALDEAGVPFADVEFVGNAAWLANYYKEN